MQPQPLIVRRSCGRPPRNEERIITMIRTVDGLTIQQQQFMEYRYVEVLREFRARCRFYAGLFHTFRTVITIGSLLVPALLSVIF